MHLNLLPFFSFQVPCRCNHYQAANSIFALDLMFNIFTASANVTYLLQIRHIKEGDGAP